MLRRLLVRHLLRRLYKCAEKGRLKVKMKGHLKQRRARSGEAKKKTRVISQWENVNCEGVFPEQGDSL